MAEHKSGNFSFANPPFKDGDDIYGGNYTQLQPNTEICKDVKDLTIYGGNFVNCKPQPTWDIQGGNWCQISFCTHERPELVERGLKPCGEACVHRQGSVKQWVDSRKKEYLEEVDSLNVNKPRLRVLDHVDAYGINTQTFEKEVFVYKPTVVKNGAQVKKDQTRAKR